MQIAPNLNLSRAFGLGLTAAVGLALAGCGGMATNNTLYSTKQAVVERESFSFDVATTSSGLSIPEQTRLNGWFETMELGYGDRVTVENPGNNPAVMNAVNELAGRYGLIVEATAPTTPGFIDRSKARIVITRSTASVPGCPDWSKSSDMNYFNATSSNFGCATNSNIAAMVANPEDLLEGQEATSKNVVVNGNRAIETYRTQAPSGAGGLANPTGGN